MEYFQSVYIGRAYESSIVLNQNNDNIDIMQRSGLFATDTLTTMVVTQTCLLRGTLKLFLQSCESNCSKHSFHNKLKNHPRYLDHKPNRRLDDLIHILLKFESETFIAQTISTTTTSPYSHNSVHMYCIIVYCVCV